MSDKILHGQPDPDNLTNDTLSLGEYCIKQLKQHGDSVLVVSIYLESDRLRLPYVQIKPEIFI